MNRSQYLSAIRAIGPGLTARFTDGEFRVSIDPAAIRAAYPALTYREAIERNESLAAYETDGDSALATAKALRESWLREVAAIDSDFGRAAKAELSFSPATAEPEAREVETIDMTPTWAGIAGVYVLALECGTETGRAAARTEIARMAALADERNAFAARIAKAGKIAREIRGGLSPDGGAYAAIVSILDALDEA